MSQISHSNMRRLVYSPRIDVYIKRDDGEIVDLSPYVTSCNVNRKINQVSRAQVSFRNPGVWDDKLGRPRMLFTEYQSQDKAGKTVYGPMFHPMDPIIVTLTRLRDRPIQVFTGYCDTTPYFQLRPGVVSIDASCTLKRLLHTYWDPALPFVQEFLYSRGWDVNPATGLVTNIPAESRNRRDGSLSDSGFGDLLFSVLEEIGGWDASTIDIEQLPKSIIPIIAELFDETQRESKKAQKEFHETLKKMLGPVDEDGSGGSSDDVNLRGKKNVEKTYNFLRDKGFTINQAAGAVGSMMGESGESLDTSARNPRSGAYGIAQWLGGRKANLLNRRNHHLLSVQLDFLWDELQGDEKAAYNAMKGTKTLEDACYTWTAKYERPDESEYKMDERNKFAKSVKNQYGDR